MKGKMLDHKWFDFSKTVVNEMACVKKNENLLILADTWTDLGIAELCFEAGRNIGAKTNMHVFPMMKHNDVSELDEIVSNAILASDVIIGLCETMFIEKEATRKARKKGARVSSTMLRGMEEFAIEGLLNVDYNKMLQESNKISEIWRKTKLCNVSCPNGTNISFSLEGRPVDIGDGISDKPGEADFFPGVDVNIAPIEKTINGKIVVDGCIDPGNGIVNELITLNLKNGVITDIEGGKDANLFLNNLESANDEKVFHLCHFTLGLNPVAKKSNNMHECEHVVGAVTFGFGDQDPGFKGTIGEAKLHSDVVIMSPKIILDNQTLVENNKIINM